MIDAKSQITSYQYFIDNNLKSVTYANAIIATPGVSFTYDTNYNRLLTMVDGRTRLAQQVEEEVRRHFGQLVFRTSVPRSVRLAEAPSHGLPAIAYDRRSAGADAYWKVAMELVERA